MARFWVGGTSTWDATAGTKWATTDGGAGGAAVPTAADDVFFTALSGVNTVTTVGTTNCLAHNVDCTGFTGTFVHDTSTTVTVSGSLKLVAGMTYTRNASCQWTFNATATGQTIDFGTKTNIGIVLFAGVGGGWQFTSGFTASATAIFTLTNGALDFGGQTISLGLFSSSNANVRTVTMGASNVTITGLTSSTVWDFTTSTNLTFNANGSTITFSGSGGTVGSNMIQGGGKTFNNIVVNGAGSPAMGSGLTMANLTRTGTAVKTDGLSFNSSGTYTITGTLTLNGNSPSNRLLITSNSVGVAHTISAAVVSLTNTDFIDIAAGGAAIPWTGTSLGDAGGNSNITFDTPVTQTWNANTTGSWSAAANWTSRVPLPQDSVAITGLTSGVITSDMPRLGGSIDFTGSTGGTLTFSAVGASFGSLTFNSGLAITGNANAQLTLSGRSSYTITSNGTIFPGGSNGVLITAPNGTYTLQDNAPWVGNFSLIAGSFNTNNFNLSCNLMTATGTLTRALTLGTSTITMVRTSAGSIFQVTSTGLTLSAANTTFVYAQTSPNAHSFDGAGLTYGALQITGGSGTSFAITGANTFTGTVTASPDTVLTWPSSTTNTIGSLSATGQNYGYNYFPNLASNFASTPNAADLQLTGDFDFRVLVDLDNYRPTVAPAFITKWDAAIPNRSYSFSLNTNGTLAISLTSDNTTPIGSTSSVAVTATPGTPIWLRGARAGTTVTFYTSPDGSTWNQLGTTGTNATTIITGTAALVVGGFGGNGSNPLGGKLYYAEVRSSVGGTIVANPDFRTKVFGANSFADTAGTPKTWTMTGAQAQAGDGRVLINSSVNNTAATLSSTNRVALDYVTVQDNTAAGNTPFYAGSHGVLISGDTNWLAIDHATLFNDYQFVHAGDGISVTEGIR